MKIVLPALVTLAFFGSCTNSSSNKEAQIVKPVIDSTRQPAENNKFFPVTAYIKGQLFDIMKKGVNPLKYTTVKGHTDSAWLKIELLQETVKEFLEPEIDSANLTTLFMEKKFLDQTLDAFTFSYDPLNQLPDTMKLLHWDVYVNPESGKVKRVYMVKSSGTDRTLQLTWIGDKWCKITTLINNSDGSSVVEKEEKITWDY